MMVGMESGLLGILIVSSPQLPGNNRIGYERGQVYRLGAAGMCTTVISVFRIASGSFFSLQNGTCVVIFKSCVVLFLGSVISSFYKSPAS